MINTKSLTIPEGRVARILVGEDVIWKTRKIITNEDMLVKNTGAEKFDSLNLTTSAPQGVKNEDYYTFKYIPIEPGATYYALYGTRSWFFDSEKNKLNSINVRTQGTPYQFKAPAKACYISISYNYSTAEADAVAIRKVEE